MLRFFRNGGDVEAKTKTGLFIDQLIDSAVVAGIVFFTELATQALTWESLFKAMIGFGLTFTIKLKDYRQIT